MGVLHCLYCDKCEQYIDLDKAYSTIHAMQREVAPLFGCKEEELGEPLRTTRALWFLWRHKEHGSEVHWSCDSGGSKWEIEEKYFEVEKF